jgi:hypothetical protein
MSMSVLLTMARRHTCRTADVVRMIWNMDIGFLPKYEPFPKPATTR